MCSLSGSDEVGLSDEGGALCVHYLAVTRLGM